MVISDRYGFILITPPKTGSESLKRHLERFGFRAPQNMYSAHMVPGEIVKKPYVGIDRWDQYMKVCFIRNPWDRYVSCYLYLNRHRVRAWGQTAFGSFETFLHTGGYEAMHLSEFLFWPNDTMCVDFVGRFERFDTDVMHLFDKLGIPRPPRVRHDNRINHPDRKPYQEYYTEQWMIDVVAEREQKLLSVHNYRFGD